MNRRRLSLAPRAARLARPALHATSALARGPRAALRPATGLALLAALAIAGCGGSQAAPEDVTDAAPLGTTAPTATAAPILTATPVATPAPTATPVSFFDPDLHRLASKQHALPAGYEPDDLVVLPPEWAAPGQEAPVVREVVAAPLLALLEDARADGLDIRIRSTYRSFATQQETFQFWIDYLGEEQARRESAEPGHSEHQLGTAVDFASAAVGWELIAEFGDTREGQWLAARAWGYGFALSYPRESEEITGYVYEPWHLRYIGRPAAAAWRQGGVTLIEFLLAMYEAAGVATPTADGTPPETETQAEADAGPDPESAPEQSGTATATPVP